MSTSKSKKKEPNAQWTAVNLPSPHDRTVVEILTEILHELKKMRTDIHTLTTQIAQLQQKVPAATKRTFQKPEVKPLEKEITGFVAPKTIHTATNIDTYEEKVESFTKVISYAEKLEELGVNSSEEILTRLKENKAYIDVLDALAKIGGSATAEQISALVGKSRSTVASYLSRLHQLGILQKRHGKAHLNEEPRKVYYTFNETIFEKSTKEKQSEK